MVKRTNKRPTKKKLTSRIAFKIALVAAFAAAGLALLATSRAAEPADRVITDADQSSFASGFTVPAGEVWEFDRNQDVRIETTGSVIIRGTLRMQPSSHDVEHFIRFMNVDESNFRGGCVYPGFPVAGCGNSNATETDIGLWVIDDGILAANGSDKTSWTRLTGGADAGANTITLENNPVGWNIGDEISVVPTEPPTVRDHYQHFDERTITAVNGSQITLDSPLSYDHPELSNPGPGGDTFRAEVLNLSRNVRIEGQDGNHRTHVNFKHVTQRQAVSNVAIRYVGPRHPSDAAERADRFVLGALWLSLPYEQPQNTH